MISLADCLAMCGLSEDEVLAIAEHEHIPEIAHRSTSSVFVESGAWPRENSGHDRRRYPASTRTERSGACSGIIQGATPFPVGASNLQPPRDVSLATAQPSAPTSDASKTGLADGPSLGPAP
jgi:hypothetical protein